MNKRNKDIPHLRVGDLVIMVDCYEAELHAGKTWDVISDPWNVCGNDVVLLAGYRGGFAVENLKKVEGCNHD